MINVQTRELKGTCTDVADNKKGEENKESKKPRRKVGEGSSTRSQSERCPFPASIRVAANK